MHLVVQGRDVETADLKQLAKITGASRIERIADAASEAFRLHEARTVPGIAAICDAAQLDHAFVPEDRRLADFRLLVMDMDSTLITIETIDELADLTGLKPQVAAITERAMRGEIEYDESLRQRVALLAGLGESALDRVYDERLALSPGAGELLAGVKRHGIRILLVSGGFTAITDRLKPRLGLDFTCSNVLEAKDGKLTGAVRGRIVNAHVKREALLAVRDELGIAKGQIVGVGDGANDLAFLGECGVSVAYHAKAVVREKTTHMIDHVGLDGLLNLFN